MTAAPIYLNIYDRPLSGTRLRLRTEALQYRHRINAVGGFDTASCAIMVRPPSVRYELIQELLGARVELYRHSPLQPIWEGYISRMSFVRGGAQYSVNFGDLANRIMIQFNSVNLTTPRFDTDTPIDNTSSQAVYGIIQMLYDAGAQHSAAGLTALAQTLLLQRAWPLVSITPAAGGGDGLVQVEMQGFYHTMAWWEQSDESTTAVNVSTTAAALVADNPNGSGIISTSGTLIQTSTAATVRPYSFAGMTGKEAMTKIADQAGTSTARWIWGVTPTDQNVLPAAGTPSGSRFVYLRPANLEIAYTARISDGLRPRDLYGGLIDPATVRPDVGLRITDGFVLYSGSGDDPSTSYIESVDFDATTNAVTMVGSDDPRYEGLFHVNQYGYPRGDRIKGTVRSL